VVSRTGTHCVPVRDTTDWHVGDVGRLRLPTSDQPFAFHHYADPLLRRAPGLDDPVLHRWGWRLGERRFTVRVGILPGRGGAVVPWDIEFVEIPLPREFRDLCEYCRLKPETVLRGFLANLCSLMNLCACPREEEFSSDGSDERDLAWIYFRRTYAWALDREPCTLNTESSPPKRE
jgi:hypothetical protein